MSAGSLFEFPNPVNEVAARVVATGVTVMALCFAVLGWGWLLIPLTYGFLARVATGPTLSPLGTLATRVVAPALGRPKYTAGPPKRFAQGIGMVFTVTASVLWLAGMQGGSRIVITLLACAAMLEAGLNICLGCRIFSFLMRAGVIPDSVCEECNDLSLRIPQLARTREAPRT